MVDNVYTFSVQGTFNVKNKGPMFIHHAEFVSISSF